MKKSASILKNTEQLFFKPEASFKTKSENIYKRNGTFAVEKLKDDKNSSFIENKEKRAAKAQGKAPEEIRKQTTHKEKAAAFRQLKNKRIARTKIISKKTNRGQPIMRDRIQYLLTKIQEMRRS